jgi:uncharacterized membrane protein YraQ (UPF0718 family)
MNYFILLNQLFVKIFFFDPFDFDQTFDTMMTLFWVFFGFIVCVIIGSIIFGIVKNIKAKQKQDQQVYHGGLTVEDSYSVSDSNNFEQPYDTPNTAQTPTTHSQTSNGQKRFCEFCGAQLLSSTDKFCPNCGAQLE